MRAEPFYMYKRLYENGDIVEIKIWKVDKDKEKRLGFKYSLVLVRNGERVIGYDNAERKGDHRHYREREYPYSFKDTDKLLEDFFNDVRRFKDED